ncbi:hypothetical protein ACFYW6_39755 [Streptomyces sp. NPDC002659]|uniref:hypothetical protein n=1 Tax=Streptomyces sp. NPDC002659 TaxID=3364656 RepID=UPI0036C18CF0
MQRFAKKRIAVKATRVIAGAAAALALLLGGSSPANANDGESHRVIITNLQFSFPALNDCGAFGGGCTESQVWGFLRARTIVSPYQPHSAGVDYIKVAAEDQEIDVKQGVWYPTKPEISLYGHVTGGMQVYANLVDQVKVTGDFTDDDFPSNDDVICNFDSWGATVNVLRASQGWQHIVAASGPDSDGRCAVSFDVIATKA